MRLVKSLIPVVALLLPGLLFGQAPIVDASEPPRSARQTEIPSEQNLQMEIYQQLQSLQQEVMELRGIIEEQEHQLRTLKQQSLDRYIELDRRIAGGQGGSSAKPSSAAKSASPRATGAVPTEEIDAYRNAYERVKAKKFPEAIKGFEDFLKEYPDGVYAPNALYWIGELELVNTPRDLNAAEKAFSTLLEKYPDHSKVPDAMYKLAKVRFLNGDKGGSKKLLDELIAKHGDSNRSAIKFARQFLQDNF